MKKLKVLALMVGLGLSFAAVPVGAQGVWGACADGAAGSSAICADAKGTEATDIIKTLLNTALFAIGALSVVMITHSGFKYVNSRGDPEGVKSAKNTLMYAIVGLIVAMLAFVIVNFIIGAFSGTNPADGQSAYEAGMSGGVRS